MPTMTEAMNDLSTTVGDGGYELLHAFVTHEMLGVKTTGLEWDEFVARYHNIFRAKALAEAANLWIEFNKNN